MTIENYKISNIKIDINKYKDFIKNYNNYVLIKSENIINIKDKSEFFDNTDENTIMLDYDMEDVSNYIKTFFCPVVYNARINNHKLIIADDLNIDNIKGKEDWYQSVKIYDSITCEPISEKFQLRCDGREIGRFLSKSLLFLNVDQINELIDEFVELVINTKLELRFIPKGKRNCEEVLFDVKKNKPIHKLLNHKRSSDVISGMGLDTRIKALIEYNIFKECELKIVGDLIKEIKFLYADGEKINQEIPRHLQVNMNINKIGTSITLVMPKFHNDDPRYKCLSEFYRIFNSEKVIKINKNHAILDPKNTKYKKNATKLKDGSYLVVVDAFDKNKNVKTLSIQYLENNDVKIFTKNQYIISDGYYHIKSENKKLCKRCENFVFQLFDDCICINCVEHLIKRKKIRRKKSN